MSESNLYKDGGTITTQNINKRNAEKAAILDGMERESAAKSAYQAGADKGVKVGYEEFERQLAKMYPPAQREYGPPEPPYVAPSLLDIIKKDLKNYKRTDLWTPSEPEHIEKSPEQKAAEFEQMQYESEQAGLAELAASEALNRQQY